MDKKFLTFLMVISLQQFQVTLGQPNVDVTFTVDTITTITATLNWDASNSTFADSTYSISIAPSGPMFNSSSGAGSVFSSAGFSLITNLNPGTQYTITVTFDDGMSSGTQAIVVTDFNADPLPPSINMPITVTTSSATVSWAPDSGSEQEKYVLDLVSDETNDGEVNSTEIDASQTSKVFSNLASGSLYTVTVKAKSGTQESTEVSETFTTSTAAPDGVTDIQFAHVTTTTMDISWAIDASTNWESISLTLDNLDDDNVASDTASVTSGNTYQFTGLKPGHQYQVTVVVINNGVSSAGSQKTEYTKPSAPMGLAVSSLGTTSVTLTWSLDTASKQDEFVYTLNGTSETTLNDNAASTETITTTAGQTYIFSIQAIRSSVQSEAADFTFTSKPEPPTISDVTTFGTTTATVSWSPGDSSTQDSYKYILTAWSTSTQGTPSTVSDLSKDLVNLKPGESYTITIVGISNMVESDPVMKNFTTKPLQPTAIEASAITTDSVIVSWTLDTNSVQDMYAIELINTDTASVFSGFMDTTDTTKSFTGLASGYEYRVNVKSKSGTQESATATTTFSTLPTAATDILFNTIETTSMGISWVIDSTTRRDSVSLTLENLSNNTVPIVTEAGVVVSSFNFTPLKPGHEYKVTVVIFSHGVQSAPKTETENTVPLAPSSVTVTAADTEKIRVTWVASTDSSNRQDGYVIKVNNTDAMCEAPVVDFVCVIDVSKDDAGMLYSVTVLSTAGTQQSSATIGSGNTKPLDIGAITAQAQNVNQLILKALKPAGSVISELDITVLPTTDNINIVTNSDHYVITINGLTPGTKHDIKVTTKSGMETGTPKAAMVSTKPAPPTVLNRKSATTSSMVVSWAAPSDGGYDGFAIFSDNIVTDSTIGKTVFEYTISSLTAGTAYPVIVYSRFDGLQSEGITDTYRIMPNFPTNIRFTSVTATSFTVLWDKPAGEVTGYSIDNTVKNVDDKEYTFSGREPGTLFTITVLSQAGDLTSDPATAYVVTLPKPPTAIQIDAKTTTEVTFSWTAPVQTALVTGYRYTIVATDNSLSEDENTLDATVTRVGLSAGKRYVINVWAYTDVDGHARQQSSLSVNATVTLEPKPPTALTVAEKTTTRLHVTWTAPTSTELDRYKYKVYKSGETVTASSTSSTELIKENLDPGHRYNVDVWTEVDDAAGQPVESVYGQIMETMVPESPSSLRNESRSRTTINIAWNQPSSGTYTEYQLTVTDVSSTNVIENNKVIAKGSQSYQQTGLLASRTYRFSLVSVSGVEISSALEGDFETNSPSTPDLAVTEASPTSIDCTWAPGIDETATNAKVQVLNNGNQVGSAVDYSDGTQEHTFTGLTPGEYYTVEVTLTINGADTSQMRRIILTPLQVSNFMISVINETEVELTWDVDTDSHQDEFVIDNGQDTYSEDYTNGDSKTRRIVNLNAGGWYRFTIHAKATHDGSSKTSPDVSNTTTTWPRGVETFTAVGNDHDTVTLTWEPKDNSNQTSYRIWFVSLSVAPTPSTREFFVDSPEKSLVLDNFYPGARYTFHIKTRSGTVESALDDTIPVRLVPIAPVSSTLTVTPTTTEITVVWVTPPSVITKYRFGYAVRGSSDFSDMTLDGASTSKIIDTLIPGQKYTVRIFSLSHDKESPTATTKDTTLVPVMTALMTENEGTRTDEVVIEYTAETGNGVFDEYIFTINGESSQILKPKSDTNRVVLFSQLTPGTLYTVSGKVRSGDQLSTPVQNLQVLTVPEIPTIICSEELSTEISVQIGRPRGEVTSYIIECFGENCEPKREPAPSQDSLTSVTYTSLAPFNTYQFFVSAFRKIGTHEKTGGTAETFCETIESAPEAVATFTILVGGYDVTLRWTQPIVRNGLIRNYTLTYEGTKENNPTKVANQTLAATQYDYTFRNLIAGYTYTFTIRAVTVEAGVPETLIHFFPILAPSLGILFEGNPDSMKPKVTGPEPSETEFVVQLVNPFTETNGKIASYSVIVATSNQELSEDTTLLKWSKAQQGAFESPYIAINECPDLFEPESDCHKVVTARRKREAGETVEITIGGDQSCTPESKDYCNGKLSPNTNYYVLLRAYTETGLHADTPFSAPILTAPKDQTILIAVVCAVVAALIFIIVIVLVVILVRRKKRKSDDDPGTGMGPVSHKSSFKEPEITSIPVKIDKFDEHVTHMSADSDFRFAEEYEDLKQVGRDQSWSISELPVNRPKNRFTNILPYDHSRVKLLPTDDEEGSDYINANWMPGYNSKREFIVTQGALPATTDDFWRMMWEQNSRAIVMLTKCVERGREKCHHYWPVDSEPIFYGDLQVTVLNETKDPEWVITEFKLAKGEISRKVLHFHYTAWPDFDVPEKPQSLINFVRIVRGRVGIHGGPITVHCSAGVGRSGTYICIDRLLQVIQNTDVVDIYGIVYEMRRERCFMVQTERQYICIHQCLLCVIKGEDEDPENVYENGQVNPGFEEDDGIVMD